MEQNCYSQLCHVRSGSLKQQPNCLYGSHTFVKTAIFEKIPYISDNLKIRNLQKTSKVILRAEIRHITKTNSHFFKNLLYLQIKIFRYSNILKMSCIQNKKCDLLVNLWTEGNDAVEVIAFSTWRIPRAHSFSTIKRLKALSLTSWRNL